MSADDSKSVVLKGVTHGAVDYLIKPVRIEALKNIWQHVVRKKQNVSEHSGSVEETGGDRQEQLREDDDADNNSSSGNNEGNLRSSRKEEDDKEDTPSLKKRRIDWSVELHQQFVAAVNHLGVDKAVPKKILEMMNVPGLTRENVASHLQKYRIYLRRLGGVSQHQGSMNHSFMSSQDPSFSPSNGYDLQALGVAGQLPAHSLAQLQATGLCRPSSLIKPGMSVDQRSIFSFENSKSRFEDGHGQMMMNSGGGNKQRSLLHGVPTGHMHLQQQQMAGMRAGQNVQSSGMLMPVADQRGPPMQQQSMLSRRSGLTDAVAARNSVLEIRSSRVLPATHSVFDNSFPLASAPGMLVSDTKGGSSAAASTVTTAGFYNSSYDIFNDFPQQQQHNGVNEWDLRNTGMVFSSHQDTAAAFSTSEAYSSSSSQKRKREAELMVEHGQLQRGSVNHMNGGSDRVKTETVTCPPATTLFHEEYDQEDLMSALLEQEGFPSVDNEFDFEGFSIDNILV